MKFSVIIPSYNQDKFIGQTFENLKQLKERTKQSGIDVEILLFDNQSNEATQKIINNYKSIFDFVEIVKDKGQYDAINKGIAKVTGDYWTWLNTDDLIEIEGFLKMAKILKNNPVDYIYGSVEFVNEENERIRTNHSTALNYKKLVNDEPGIYQPGSFFRKGFTDKIGVLNKYVCCFDYEYVLRILKNKGELLASDFVVSRFRLHTASKTSNITVKFVKEQLIISKQYGRKPFSKLAFIAYLRLIKHGLLGMLSLSRR